MSSFYGIFFKTKNNGINANVKKNIQKYCSDEIVSQGQRTKYYFHVFQLILRRLVLTTCRT